MYEEKNLFYCICGVMHCDVTVHFVHHYRGSSVGDLASSRFRGRASGHAYEHIYECALTIRSTKQNKIYLLENCIIFFRQLHIQIISSVNARWLNCYFAIFLSHLLSKGKRSLERRREGGRCNDRPPLKARIRNHIISYIFVLRCRFEFCCIACKLQKRTIENSRCARQIRKISVGDKDTPYICVVGRYFSIPVEDRSISWKRFCTRADDCTLHDKWHKRLQERMDHRCNLG